jgi:hypothetical protein
MIKIKEEKIMYWGTETQTDAVDWLLSPDPENPGIRFFALKDLLDRPAEDPEVRDAQEEVMTTGPVPVILAAQDPEGWWAKAGPGYWPKYQSTVWQIIFLAQLGADGNHPRIRTACEYLLEHNQLSEGGLSATGVRSGLIHCLQGNLGAALLDFGWGSDPRVQKALDWLARSITGEGIALSEDRQAEVRYLRSGNSGPGFLCSANNHLPCAWGAIKALLALSKVSETDRTPSIRHAIEVGSEFLLSVDPASAMYPMGDRTKPNRSWFRFGYPIGYVTDVLQNLEVLTALGFGDDPRLAPAKELLLEKQTPAGPWPLEYTYNGKTWVDIEEKGQPSKWVTLRALRVLKQKPH